MANRLSMLFSRAKDIYQQEGLVTLLKRIFTFPLSWFSYENSQFYLYADVLEHKSEADFMPKIKDCTFKALETTQQLDELLNSGFDLSLLNITQARYRLEKGAIATLIFTERELALRGWLATTEEAKNTFNSYPYKVDFKNNEACGGDVWTNPKYRRQGLAFYAGYKRREFLISKGVKKQVGIALSTNVATINLNIKRERQVYAKARYFRIGRMQFWKETPVESIKNDE